VAENPQAPQQPGNSEEPCKPEDEYCELIGAKEHRKIQARKRGDQGVWFGLGMFGMIGWSVAIPTVVGISLGIWIDREWPSEFSWTLMLLVGGLMLGCLNAWYWLNREQEDIKRAKEDEQDE